MRGLLWFDNDPTASIETKIQRAAARYRAKNGKEPNACHVHPALENAPETVGGIQVKRVKGTLVNHFFIGIEQPTQ